MSAYDSLSADRRHQLSKQLALLLRHDKAFYAEFLRVEGGMSDEERQWRENGFAAVVDVVKFMQRGVEKGVRDEMIVRIVESQTGKIRMELNPARTQVRALNGHSNGVCLPYRQVPPPPVAFHLTNDDALHYIIGKQQGLRTMTRDHVHMMRSLDPKRLSTRDKKRSVIVQVNFPVDDEEKLQQLGVEYLLDPEVNDYLFSRRPIPAELLQRRCTVEEYLKLGCKLPPE